VGRLPVADRASAGSPESTTAIAFTDVESSTALLRELGGDAFAELLAWHVGVVREVIAESGGVLAWAEGDGTLLLFASAADAARAATTLLRRFEEDGRLRVRIGVHVGEARQVGTQYVGLGIHQAARVVAAAHGGQVLVSEAALEQAQPLPADLSSRPLGAFRLRDHDGPVRLHRVSGEGPPQVDLAPRAIPATSHALRPPRHALFGRSQEMDRLRALVKTGRCVTVVGPGGVGKTRMALEISFDAAAWTPDGTWWIDLTGITEASQVTPALASGLGLRPDTDGALSESVLAAVIGRSALLVLDGVEHVIGEVTRLLGELLAVPGPAVLVTSRSALGVEGEAVVRLRPLAPPHAGDDAATILTNDAARLFADCAARADPAFVLDPSTAPLVAEVCRIAEGLPLSIELAAARLSVSDLSGLVEHLRDLGPLAAADNVGELIAWAWDRLSPAARLVHRRLAIVRSAVPSAAVASIAGLTTSEARHAIDALVECSLLEPEHGDEQRWVQLEAVRQHARLELDASNDRVDAELGLARWSVAALAEVRSAAAVEKDLALHRLGFAAAVREQDPVARDLAHNAEHGLLALGLADEAAEWATAALALPAVAGGATDSSLRFICGAVAAGREHWAEAKATFEGILGQPDLTLPQRAELLLRIAELDLAGVDVPGARERFVAAAEAAAATGGLTRLTLACAGLVQACLVHDDVDGARGALRRASDAADATGLAACQVAVAAAEGHLARHLGDTARARRAAETLLDDALGREAWSEVVDRAWNLADLACAEADLDTASRAVSHLVAAAERLARPDRLVLAHGYAQGVAIDAGRLDVMREHTARLHALMPLLGELPRHRFTIRIADVNVAIAEGDLAALRSAVDRVEPTADELADPIYLCSHGFVLAPAWLNLGRVAESLDLALRSADAAGAVGEHLVEAVSRLCAAQAHHTLGQTGPAASEVDQALRLGLEASSGAVIAPCLALTARLMGAAAEHAVAAAELIGASDAQRELLGTSGDPFEQREHGTMREALRATLGDEAMAAAEARGAGLDRTAAVESAFRILAALQATSAT
jgi:class 3 adenylate cyclase/tetratricopeptide (TPR) repeat protein